MLEGVTKVHTASTNTFSADPKHMFSVSAASPGRANSLLQKYFLQTRVPWQEMGARSSYWAHLSTPTRYSQHWQECWCLAGHWRWLTAVFLVKQFKKQIFKPAPATDPSSLAVTLWSQKLLLLAEKAHCLLKKSAVLLIQEVSMDISGNTETMYSLLNVSEWLD